MNKHILYYLTIFLLLNILFGCQIVPPPEDQLILTRARYPDLPNWADDNILEAYYPMRQSCERLLKKQRRYKIINEAMTKGMYKACEILLESKINNNYAFRKYLKKWFVPYKAQSINRSLGFFTGYYIPVIKGSKVKTAKYNIPIYARPKDLVIVEDLGIFRPEQTFKNKRIAGKVKNQKLVPYFTRKEIEKGSLQKRGLELAWTDNIVDLFFMQIQGSGIVLFEDGEKVLFSYDGTNGHEYTAIGKVLLKNKKIAKKEISLFTIKKWLYNNPEKIDEILNKNKSYVFFKQNSLNVVVGAQKTQLYPLRSIAVDSAHIPLGIPVWIDISTHTDKSLKRLTVAQDTGGAIRGPDRADLYCGEGIDAEDLAGYLKNKGQYYLLLPKI